ncbi:MULTISPECIES: SagB/ThcOx family dehydrogenase [unclassified Bradyrhizobium]|uniref:SagB/ThcOx family dehydrogenase n=1 Tax=unclassified Bradyrhizobium TaxID=2631580 RepID=UPI0028F09727|nr:MULTISPECIES: SagB/ThcOx family dehydrogenase [unclassified Bradyrhizobium]
MSNDPLLDQLSLIVRRFPQLPSEREREAFKAELRKKTAAASGTVSVSLADAASASPSVNLLDRRNHREFSNRPIGMAELTRVLSPLRATWNGDRWRFNYASASSLYGISTFLIVHRRPYGPGLARSQAGSFRFDPRAFGLNLIEADACIGRDAHAALNQPVFERAAISLYLIADFGISCPVYGANGIRFALLEAGLMSQLIDQSAPSTGIGVCHVGAVDGSRLDTVLRLRPGQVLLHSMLLGCVTQSELRPEMRTLLPHES